MVLFSCCDTYTQNALSDAPFGRHDSPFPLVIIFSNPQLTESPKLWKYSPVFCCLFFYFFVFLVFVQPEFSKFTICDRTNFFLSFSHTKCFFLVAFVSFGKTKKNLRFQNETRTEYTQISQTKSNKRHEQRQRKKKKKIWTNWKSKKKIMFSWFFSLDVFFFFSRDFGLRQNFIWKQS